MGIFDSFTKRRAARRAERARAVAGAEMSVWQEQMDKVDEMLTIVRDCAAGRAADHFTDRSDYGFMLTGEEFAVAYLQQVAYLENVRAPARYSGGYGGVSFPLFGGLRVNTGRMGGKRIPGEESITVTDEGNALVTNSRIMFVGSKRTHEWEFAKMVSASHHADGWTVFAMKGRGKPTGLGYGDSVATEVQFRLELAAAMALGSLDRYASELEAEKLQMEAGRPAIPPPPPPPAP